MSYMGHSESCTCSECYVRRQQVPQAPLGVGVVGAVSPVSPGALELAYEMLNAPGAPTFATPEERGAAAFGLAAKIDAGPPPQQEIRGLGPENPEWRFIGGTVPGVTPGVHIREAVPLPGGVDWTTLEIVGAARLKLGAEQGEVVALLARFTWGPRRCLAIWWDKTERVIKVHGVDESAPTAP